MHGCGSEKNVEKFDIENKRLIQTVAALEQRMGQLEKSEPNIKLTSAKTTEKKQEADNLEYWRDEEETERGERNGVNEKR